MPQPNSFNPERELIIKGSAHLKKLEERGQPKSERFHPKTESEKMVSNTRFKLSPVEKRAAAEYMDDMLK